MDSLRTKTKWLRAPVVRGISGRIEREGGDNSAGLIRQVALATRGEALGHDLWLDKHFIRSVRDEVESRDAGVKSRFTHPGLSGDGLARFLGRVKNAKLAAGGDIVRGDLHFSETSHATPDGDLATYVMDLAEKDPTAFGTSIVFQHDYEAEDELEDKTKGRSNDRRNEKNLRHARLLSGSLRASDVVDEPAANPGGLFHVGDDIAAVAEELLAFSLGITDELSYEHFDVFDVDPDRLRRFVADFMGRRNLALVTDSYDAMMDRALELAKDPDNMDLTDYERERMKSARATLDKLKADSLT